MYLPGVGTGGGICLQETPPGARRTLGVESEERQTRVISADDERCNQAEHMGDKRQTLGVPCDSHALLNA